MNRIWREKRKRYRTCLPGSNKLIMLVYALQSTFIHIFSYNLNLNLVNQMRDHYSNLIGEKTGSGSEHFYFNKWIMNKSINIIPCSRKNLRLLTMKYDVSEEHILKWYKRWKMNRNGDKIEPTMRPKMHIMICLYICYPHTTNVSLIFPGVEAFPAYHSLW